MSSYCLAVESHLVRRNRGHLIRIVGPAFDLVRGWEDKGIPLTAVLRGIDRYVERSEAKAKGERRRPVQIQFCEADVLDVFDEWRRAVGVTGTSETGGPSEAGASRKKEALSSHLERVVARLTALRSSSSAGSGPGRTLDAALEDTIRQLDAARGTAKGLRGEARQALLERLRALQRTLTQAARDGMSAADVAALGREADAELAPFRDRMPAETYQRSREACLDRLVQERACLPVITLDP